MRQPLQLLAQQPAFWREECASLIPYFEVVIFRFDTKPQFQLERV
jgi:hypothetical protein